MGRKHRSQSEGDNKHQEQPPPTEPRGGVTDNKRMARSRSSSLPEQLMSIFTKKKHDDHQRNTGRRKREGFRFDSSHSTTSGRSFFGSGRRDSTSIKEAARRGSLTEIHEKIDRGEAKFKPGSSLSFLESATRTARRFSSRLSQRLSTGYGKDEEEDDEEEEKVDEDGQKIQ